MSALFSPITVLILIVGGIAVLPLVARWRFNHLYWPVLTTHELQKYLRARGWLYAGNLDQIYKLTKGDLQIIISCLTSERVTLAATKLAFDQAEIDGRHPCVFYKNEIEPGVREEALKDGISLIHYKQLGEFESILRRDETYVIQKRRDDAAMMTRDLLPVFAAKLLPLTADQQSPNFTNPHANLVAETENVQCYLRETQGQTLLVFFNESWRCGVWGRLFPGMAPDLLGFSVVDIISKRPNWYPADDMAAIIPVITKRIKGRFTQVINIGFSQGGYGALKFSKAFGATTTIALSPQFSLDPRVVKHGALSEHFDSRLNIGMAISGQDCSNRAFVLFDPYQSSDRVHVEALRAELAITEVEVPFAGHATGRLIHTVAGLKRVIANCSAGDVASLRAFIAENRRLNPDRAFQIANAIADRRVETALRLTQKYRPIWPPRQLAHICFRLCKSKYLPEAYDMACELAASHPEDGDILACAARLAQERGKLEQALDYIRLALDIDPDRKGWLDLQKSLKAAYAIPR